MVAGLVVHDAIEHVCASSRCVASVQLTRALTHALVTAASVAGVAVIEVVGRVVIAVAIVVSPRIAARASAVVHAVRAAAIALTLGVVVLVGPGAPSAHGVASARRLVDARTGVGLSEG